ncbi:MAG: serine hydrolase, partial [Bacteroides sp.]
MKRFIITLITYYFVQIGFSQESSFSKLDTYLETLAQNDKFMGTICVSRDGKNTYTKSVGFSNIEAKIKANQNSIYKIGSISKSFTST